MTYADLLLHIDTYPTPTTREGIDEAVGVAVSLGGGLTGLAIEVDIPVRSNRLADYLIGLSAMADAEEARSRAAGHDGLARHALRAPTCPVLLIPLTGELTRRDDVTGSLPWTR